MTTTEAATPVATAEKEWTVQVQCRLVLHYIKGETRAEACERVRQLLLKGEPEFADSMGFGRPEGMFGDPAAIVYYECDGTREDGTENYAISVWDGPFDANGDAVTE